MRKLRATTLRRITLGCACALVFLINASGTLGDSGTDRALISSNSSSLSSDSSSDAGFIAGAAPNFEPSSSAISSADISHTIDRSSASTSSTDSSTTNNYNTTDSSGSNNSNTANNSSSNNNITANSSAPDISDAANRFPTNTHSINSPVTVRPDADDVANSSSANVFFACALSDRDRELPSPTSLPSPSATAPNDNGISTSKQPTPGGPNSSGSPSPSYFEDLTGPATAAPQPIRDDDDDVGSPSPPPRQVPPPAPPINPSRNPSRTAGPQPSSPRTPPPPAGDGGGGGSRKENREATESPSTTSAPGSSASPSAMAGRDPPAASNPPEPTPAATPAPTPKRYRRGDDVIIVAKEVNGTTVTVEVVVAPSQSPAVVVRDAGQAMQNNNNKLDTNGNNTNSAGATTGDTGSASGDGNSDRVYAFLQYLCSSLAFASLVLLVGFHFAALQPAATPSMSSGSGSVVASLSRPNQWELLVFISYIQALGACAHYVVWAAPAFFWKFVDAFSWTACLPFHFNGSGISYVAAASNATSRRLVEIVVLDGFVAFADRIGVNEENLLKTCAAGFLVVCGVLLLVALAVAYFIAFHQDDVFDSEPGPMSDSLDCAQVLPHEPMENTKRRPVWILQGLVVIVAAFAVYPLVAIATFEIVSQIRASKVASGPLAIALVTVFGACAAFIAYTLASIASAQDTRLSYRRGVQYCTVWGSLCSGDWIQYKWRVVFASAWIAVQLLSAIVVGAVRSEAWQLGLLIAVNVAFMVVVASTRPFTATATARLATVATYFVTSVKIFNTALALAFLSPSSGGSTPGHRRSVATAFIVVNCVIIVLWFTRLFGLACRLVRDTWDNRRRARKNTDASSTFLPSATPNSTRHQDAQYVAMPSKESGNAGRR